MKNKKKNNKNKNNTLIQKTVSIRDKLNKKSTLKADVWKCIQKVHESAQT